MNLPAMTIVNAEIAPLSLCRYTYLRPPAEYFVLHICELEVVNGTTMFEASDVQCTGGLNGSIVKTRCPVSARRARHSSCEESFQFVDKATHASLVFTALR